MQYTHYREGLNNKGKILSLEEVNNLKSFEQDSYANLFYFDKAVVDYFNKNNSIAGYNGKAVANKLTFDFDSENDIKAAKEDVINLLAKLQAVGVNIIDSVEVFWSGNKGFHVEVLTNREFTPDEMKAICVNFAGEESTLDTSIFSTIRAFRLVNSKHNISGLYKISLNYDDLSKSIEEIKELAKQPRSTKKLVPTNVDFSIYVKPKERKLRSVMVNEDSEGIRGLDHIDFRHCPASTPRCYFALSRGIMEPGERSRMFFMLAKFYRNQGLVKETAYHLLKGIAELNSVLYPEADKITKEEIWGQHIANAYSTTSLEFLNPKGTGTSADNELLRKYCNAIKSSCKCTLHKVQSSSIMRIDEVSDTYEKFAAELKTNIVKTGIKCIDDKAQLTIGTVNLLVGSVGSGKTSMVLNILENANKIDQYSIFFSMDMNRFLIFQKIAQKVTNYSDKQIQYFYETKNKKKIDEIKEAIHNNFGKTYFDFSSSDSLDNMANKIKNMEDKEGKKVKLAVVDYAGKIASQYSDEFSNARYNATKSTGIADETGACWLYLAQISRAFGDSSTPLRSNRTAKDTSVWEESASVLMNLWRPWVNSPEKDSIMKIFLAKSRMSSTAEFILKWDGPKSEISELSEEDLMLYKEEYEQDEPGNKKIRT